MWHLVPPRTGEMEEETDLTLTENLSIDHLMTTTPISSPHNTVHWGEEIGIGKQKKGS